MTKYQLDLEYWQVKATGEIMTVPAGERSREWMKAYRQVRLLHHPEAESLMIEDVGVNLSFLDDPYVVEIDLDTYKYWKLIYDNPDL